MPCSARKFTWCYQNQSRIRRHSQRSASRAASTASNAQSFILSHDDAQSQSAYSVNASKQWPAGLTSTGGKSPAQTRTPPSPTPAATSSIPHAPRKPTLGSASPLAQPPPAHSSSTSSPQPTENSSQIQVLITSSAKSAAACTAADTAPRPRCCPARRPPSTSCMPQRSTPRAACIRKGSRTFRAPRSAARTLRPSTVCIYVYYSAKSERLTWLAMLYRWSDLGMCRRPDEREWVALTRVHGTDTLVSWVHGAGELIEARYLAVRELK